MSKSDYIRVRVEPELKAKAESILAKIGLSPSDAVRILYLQIVACNGLPLDLKPKEGKTK